MSLTVFPLRQALSTDSTAAAFTAKTPTGTMPTTATNPGFIDLFDRNLGIAMDNRAPKFLNLIPYGGNDDNDQMNVRLWGWNYWNTTSNGVSSLWVPTLLVELAVTLSGSISGSAIAANRLMADTLVVTYGATDEKTLGVSIISPANDVPASALVHLRGHRYIEFDFKLGTGGDAMNCLWRPMDEHH